MRLCWVSLTSQEEVINLGESNSFLTFFLPRERMRIPVQRVSCRTTKTGQFELPLAEQQGLRITINELRLMR